MSRPSTSRPSTSRPRTSRPRVRLWIVRGLSIGSVLGLVGAIVVGREFVNSRPYYWSPVAAELGTSATLGPTGGGGVYRHGGLYLLELGSDRMRMALSVDPVARNATLDNAPMRWFAGRRSVTLRGVMFGGGKLDSRATVTPTAEGFRVRIVPGLTGPDAPPEEIEIRLPPELRPETRG